MEDAPTPSRLELPLGLEGSAELHLAHADLAAATAVADALMAGVAGDAHSLTDAQVVGCSIKARALLLEARVEEARVVLGSAREDPRLALAHGVFSLAQGALSEARAFIRQALDRRPRGLAEMYALGMLMVVAGETDAAVPILVEVCASCPEHAVARFQLARVMVSEGDSARAGTLLEQAWAISPEFLSPAVTLAEMFVDAHQYGEAMTLLTEIAERAPNLLAPRLLQLRVLVNARRVEQAVQLAQALKSAAPDREEVLALWGEALLLAGRGAEARQTLELALPAAAKPGRMLQMLTKIAMASVPPDVETAVAHLQHAIELAPESGQLVLELAQLQLGVGRGQDAACTLETLVQNAHVELGVLLSAAALAARSGHRVVAGRLRDSAAARVAGTPAEAQVRSLMRTLSDQG
jgi:thioredoxin-like negative regulator of GroEL